MIIFRLRSELAGLIADSRMIMLHKLTASYERCEANNIMSAKFRPFREQGAEQGSGRTDPW